MDPITETQLPSAAERAVTGGHAGAVRQHANLDVAGAIRAMRNHVTKRVETEYEHAERLRRRIFPETPAPSTHWRVDWPTVHGAERWLREEWAPMAGWMIIRRKEVGNLTLSARVRRPPPDTNRVLPDPGPPSARHIHGVLLSRCAGYAVAPKAEDIVNGIESETPSEAEARAILSYLREASESEIDAAWKAGEFSLVRLMRCIDQIALHDSVRGLSSVRRWLDVEEVR